MIYKAASDRLVVLLDQPVLAKILALDSVQPNQEVIFSEVKPMNLIQFQDLHTRFPNPTCGSMDEVI